MDREYRLICPSRKELIAGGIYLPIHMLFMQLVLALLFLFVDHFFQLTPTPMGMNLAFQLVACLYLTLFMFQYLRQSWARFLEGGISGLWVILQGYGMRLILSLPIAIPIALLFPELANPNNDMVMELVFENFWLSFILIVLLAPMVEELMFRGVLFAPLLKYSRVLAYSVSSLSFGFLHILGPLFLDYSPFLFVTMLLYIPHGIALCWVYEKTGSIWPAIFLHALNNLLAMLFTQLIF